MAILSHNATDYKVQIQKQYILLNLLKKNVQMAILSQVTKIRNILPFIVVISHLFAADISHLL